jgi:hypothetical protein
MLTPKVTEIRRHGSQVQADWPTGLRAAQQGAALRGRVERLGDVVDRAVDEPRLAAVAYARAA